MPPRINGIFYDEFIKSAFSILPELNYNGFGTGNGVFRIQNFFK